MMRLAILCLMGLTACGQAESGPQKLPERVVMVKNIPVTAQVADDEGERETGLMYVKAMAQDKGMLFVWPEEAQRSFWMHETYISLDLLYIRQGTIVNIVPWAKPHDETPLASGAPVDMVLEVNGGWASAHDVNVGDSVILK